MAIKYTTSIVGVTHEDLSGFFTGWPNPPSVETLREILMGSDHFVIAMDGQKVVGFATAVSDGVLTAFIPLLEVIAEYHGKGIGKELVRLIVSELGELYAIDLICDDELKPFYGDLGFVPMTAMVRRNYTAQCGKK